MAIANTTRRVPEPKPLIDALQAMLGDRCSVNPGILDRHGHDESYHETHQAGRGGVPGKSPRRSPPSCAWRASMARR